MVDSGRPRRLRRRRLPAVDGTLAAPPQPVPPSAWMLPDPRTADADGVVGIGADLRPATLVDAYRRGIFPWPHPGVALPWFSPDPRGVLWPDRVHRSRSLRRRLRTCGWVTTVDAAFPAVLEGCRQQRGAAGTWITPAMTTAYRELHELGWAHSLEVWEGATLVGGVYGVQIGAVFTGESMFHRRSDASKAALVDLADRFAAAGGRLLDVQLTTPHLVTMGAEDLARPQFLAILDRWGDADVRLALGRRPVARLADHGPRRAPTRA